MTTCQNSMQHGCCRKSIDPGKGFLESIALEVSEEIEEKYIADAEREQEQLYAGT
jgi:hypothetical protein